MRAALLYLANLPSLLLIVVKESYLEASFAVSK